MRFSVLSGFIASVFSFTAAAEAPVGTFRQTNFVANNASYGAQKTEPKMINAWGVAIRPAGAGGHFWVTAKDVSYEYVGDVQASSDVNLRTLHVDDLPYVALPVGGADKFATGVVFIDSPDNFVIAQQVEGAEPIVAAAKFIFASDGGIISAWTERKKAVGGFDRPKEAIVIIDDSKAGSQYFGLATNAIYDRLYAVDFGKAPGIKVFGKDFRQIPVMFEMPFDDNKNGRVDAGEYAPFNIQLLSDPFTLTAHLFVAYAKTQACPPEEIIKGTCKAGEIFAGEEDISKPGQGRVAEFTEDGRLVAVWNDGGKMSAPWGMAFAPPAFGPLSHALLVANFGDGTIAAYHPKTRQFIDVMRDEKGNPIVIDKIWGILFGNGVSLGDLDALYFAAGPKDETDGLFGSLRLVK